jgi:ribosomal protein S18 acetylase RimI-like enzyme
MEHWRRLEVGSLENVLIMTQDGSEIVGSITLDSWAIVSLIRAFSLSEEMSSLLERDDEDVIALMSNLAVRKDMRGQGLARELLVAAEETASSVGYPEILFMVESSNLPALKLYKSSGYTSLFSKVSTVCEPGGEWGAQQAEVVFMRKRLLGPLSSSRYGHSVNQ